MLVRKVAANAEDNFHKLLAERRLAKAVVHRAIADLEYVVTRVPYADRLKDPEARSIIRWVRAKSYADFGYAWWLDLAWENDSEIKCIAASTIRYIESNFPPD